MAVNSIATPFRRRHFGGDDNPVSARRSSQKRAIEQRFGVSPFRVLIGPVALAPKPAAMARCSPAILQSNPLSASVLLPCIISRIHIAISRLSLAPRGSGLHCAYTARHSDLAVAEVFIRPRQRHLQFGLIINF